MTVTVADLEPTRINSVSLFRSREEVIINLDRIGRNYEVSATRLLWIGSEARVQGTMSKPFTGPDAYEAARNYANGYWGTWVTKGFRAR